ncbi:hypothetical protein DPMN_042601 [Dreissena polymorpha]|uniref:Uncharacterized protein n=1 Tax=Dreissena polymorpha TaxID=45954 RepID=A0A9D4D198_DREPO|nr:hypothetical protein DPMN_042601 [Dreissena polymorpha]
MSRCASTAQMLLGQPIGNSKVQESGRGLPQAIRQDMIEATQAGKVIATESWLYYLARSVEEYSFWSQKVTRLDNIEAVWTETTWNISIPASLKSRETPTYGREGTGRHRLGENKCPISRATHTIQ